MDGRDWFIVGTIQLIVAGGAHICLVVVDTMRARFLAPVEVATQPAMQATTIRFRLLFPGGHSRARSMWRAWLGFNMSHGLGLVAVGTVLLAVAVHDFSLVREIGVMRPLSIALSGAYLITSVYYWFYVPSVIFTVSCAAFIASALS